MIFLLRPKSFFTFHPLCRSIVSTSSLHSKRIALKLDTEDATEDAPHNKKVSTLYVPGRSGGEMYQFAKPLIDMKYMEEHLTAIDESCRIRGINLDFHHVLDVLKEWALKKNEHERLCDQHSEYKDDIKRLKVLNLPIKLEEVIKKANECIDLIKVAKENIYSVEDFLMPLLQKVPNVLTPSTPLDQDIVTIQKEPEVEDLKFLSHVEVGKDLLEFTNISPTAYYLRGSLAELEIALQVYFSEILQNANFAPMSCVDFVKSFIIEATGLDPYSCDDCIPLKRNSSGKTSLSLNLVGGASFQSFCAYLVNMNTSFETLPAKYFSLGRRYAAGNRHSCVQNLFSVVQSSAIHSTVLCDPNNENLEFKAMLETLLSCYLPLEIPFRTVDIAAPQLNQTESRKINLELWSSYQKKYIPIAYVSQHNDFVSKRLQITYGKDYAINGYCSIVEGVVVNIPVIIGCMLELFAKHNEVVDFEKIYNLLNISNK